MTDTPLYHAFTCADCGSFQVKEPRPAPAICPACGGPRIDTIKFRASEGTKASEYILANVRSGMQRMSDAQQARKAYAQATQISARLGSNPW